jgi:hypothetical protein
VQTQGGYQSNGPGAPGGPITLSAKTDLTVGGQLEADGSNAGGSANPPSNGGSAGNVTLDAFTGTLILDGNSTAQGGAGSTSSVNGNIGGTGGNGGQIVVAAHSTGELASLSSAGGPGGDYGDDQGPGGTGGEILAWTNAPIFNSQQLVSSDGGDGNPTGAAGDQDQNSSPSAPAITPTGVLSFTSQSPQAQTYRVLMSVGGAAPVTALDSTVTSGLRPNAPVCQPVSFTVVALSPTAYGWMSDPSPAVAYTRQPSATQGCSDPSTIDSATTYKISLRALRRAHWVATLPIKTSGIGQLQATFAGAGRAGGKTHRRKRKGHSSRKSTTVPVTVQLVTPGRHVLHMPLPPSARALGSYRIAVTTTSPDAKNHRQTTLTLEIVQ